MSFLVVSREGRLVKMRTGRPVDGCVERRLSSFVDLSVRQNEIASDFADEVEDTGWCLEYSKLVAAEGFAVIGQAQEIARAVCSERQPVAFYAGADRRRIGVALSKLLADQDYHLAGAGLARLFGRIRYWASVSMALAVWSWVVLRHGRGNRLADEAEGGRVVAVHGEVSNRTRHLLEAAAGSGDVSSIIVLGRPRRSLASIREEFSRRLGLREIHICRPIDLVSALRSLPRLARLLAYGSSLAARTGFLPRWQDEIAVLFRVCLGACSSEWWQRQQSVPRVIVYGHTGLADTSMLEAAQQASGAKTVHLVHGLSGGWNFVGTSSLGIFKCGHDATLHAGLPGYADTRFLERGPPQCLLPSGRKWLLMTNYAHPSNLYFGHGAMEFESQVVHAAVDVARRNGLEIVDLVWRPHPVFWDLPASAREKVLKAAGNVGLSPAVPDRPLPALQEFSFIMCTPSTVAVDLLVSGVLPIIVAPHSIAEDSVYAAFPIRAEDADELDAAQKRLSDPKQRTALFAETWQKVRPGASTVSLEDIVAMLPANSSE